MDPTPTLISDFVIPTPEFSADEAKALFDALPARVLDLVEREAYLSRAAALLDEGATAASNRLSEAQDQKPSFLAAFGSSERADYDARLKSLEADLSLINRAVTRNQDAMKRLRKVAESRIEHWLRENDASYRRGLVCEALVADWFRAITRLEAGLADFITTVGAARNSLVGDQASTDNPATRKIGDVGRAALLQAARVGAALATEIRSTNQIAEERDQKLVDTVFDTGPFPRLPYFDYEKLVKEALTLPVAQLQPQFDRVLSECQNLSRAGLPALIQEVCAAEQKHSAVKQSYMLSVWRHLHDYAVAHCVVDNELDAVASDTERLYLDGKIV